MPSILAHVLALAKHKNSPKVVCGKWNARVRADVIRFLWGRVLRICGTGNVDAVESHENTQQSLESERILHMPCGIACDNSHHLYGPRSELLSELAVVRSVPIVWRSRGKRSHTCISSWRDGAGGDVNSEGSDI